MIMAREAIESVGGFNKKSYAVAFMIGSIEPDINPLTYTRGSIRQKLLGGHNYNNVKYSLYRTFDTLFNKRKWGVLEYYKFGKSIHYVCDAFTFPHNEEYEGGLLNHHKYEKLLGKRIKQFNHKYSMLIVNDEIDIKNSIETLRNYYTREKSNITRDILFSRQAVGMTMSYFKDKIK